MLNFVFICLARLLNLLNSKCQTFAIFELNGKSLQTLTFFLFGWLVFNVFFTLVGPWCNEMPKREETKKKQRDARDNFVRKLSWTTILEIILFDLRPCAVGVKVMNLGKTKIWPFKLCVPSGVLPKCHSKPDYQPKLRSLFSALFR